MGDLDSACTSEASPGQYLGIERRYSGVGTVGTNNGVEVHQPSALELGHLAVLETEDLGALRA
jgi:hypothetical protein